MNINKMREEAEAGSCVSQSVLGICYLYGYEVEVDYREAFRWLSLAAKQGASRAVLNLAHMHANGLGIPQNVPEAIRLYEAVGKPSDSSDAFNARLELARIYALGKGIPVNAHAAVNWYSAVLELAGEDSEIVQEARAYIDNHRASLA